MYLVKSFGPNSLEKKKNSLKWVFVSRTFFSHSNPIIVAFFSIHMMLMRCNSDELERDKGNLVEGLLAPKLSPYGP